MTILSRLIVGFSILLATLTCPVSGRIRVHRQWPEVVPMSRSFSFTDPDRASLSFYIRSAEGKPVYWFGCHSADFKGPFSDPVKDDWYYYGLFDCHLHSLADKNGYNLLSYEAADPVENFSRALFVLQNLQGSCADYPDWGRVRHIYVRGMELTVEFANLQIGRDAGAINRRNPEGTVLQSFRFDVRIQTDRSAVSEFAEPPRFADPLRQLPGSSKNISEGCKKIVPQVGP